MTDALWGYDAAGFPLPSLVANSTSVLELADPAIFELCWFFQAILNANLLPRFSDEAKFCGVTHANLDNWVDGYAVGQVIAFPLNQLLLKTTDFKFPLLSVYPEKDEYHSISSMKTGKKRDIVVVWVLPPLTPFQYNRLYPFFGVASNTFEVYGQQGLDPKVNPTRSVWNIAGISFGCLVDCQYKPYMGLDKGGSSAVFPAIQMRLSFFERNQVVNQNYPILENIFIEGDLYDGYSISNPILNFADGYATTTMTMTSASPAVGSIQGGTWITIKGTGFSPTLTQQASQITVCGAVVNHFAILAPTVLRVITSPSIDGAIGIGDIVITDNQDNVVTLHNSFTYTSP